MAFCATERDISTGNPYTPADNNGRAIEEALFSAARERAAS
jgi:hypothetical protein